MSKTQTRKVYQHLQQHKSITPLEALSLYGCFRLGARIWELRKAGVPVKTEIVEVETRAGVSKVAKYVIEA
jgi:hypothetical protein